MPKKEPAKALFDVKHDFYSALDNYVHQAGMLADAVRTALHQGAISAKVADIIKERLEAVDSAAHGHKS